MPNMRSLLRRFLALGSCLLVTQVAAGTELTQGDAIAVPSPETLFRNLFDQRLATDPEDILKYAELVQGSVQVIPWSSWRDYQTRITLLDAAVEYPKWSSSYAAKDYVQALADDAKSNLLPQVTGGVEYGQRYSGANPMSRSLSMRYGALTSKINLTQLIYDGDAARDSWLSAVQKAKAQELRAEVEQSGVLLELLEASLNSQRFQIHKFWLIKLEKQREKTAEKVMQRFNLGASTIYDLARTDLKRYDAQILFGQVEQQLSNANTLLREYKVIKPVYLPVIAQMVVTDVALLSELDLSHPLIKEARLLVDAAQLNLRSTKASRNSAKVSLEGAISRRDFDAYGKPAYDASVLLTLTHNFYTGGRDSSQVEQSVARLTQITDELDLRVRNLRTTITQAGAEINQLTFLLEKRKASLNASLVVYAASARLMDLKRGDLTDLQRVEEELNNAMRLLVDNWFDLAIAYYRYLHLTNDLKKKFFEAYLPSK